MDVPAAAHLQTRATPKISMASVQGSRANFWSVLYFYISDMNVRGEPVGEWQEDSVGTVNKIKVCDMHVSEYHSEIHPLVQWRDANF